MKISIECKQSRWLVNGKRLNELDPYEKGFMNEFFRRVKTPKNPQL